MALRERKAAVFRSKVLERLFPIPPGVVSSSVEASTVAKAPDSHQEGSENTAALSVYSSLPDKKREDLTPRKIYTVTPPPEDYVPPPNAETSSENSESDDDHEVDFPEENDQGQPQRKRLRKKKRKNVLQNPDNLHGGLAECGKPENLIEDKLQHTEGLNLSRNKKRKMKKKWQKEKMRAAGLLTKPTGIDFMYKPKMEKGTDFEDTDKKIDSILDFLQATQEIYFSDKRSKCEESAVSPQSIHEILHSLESHHMPLSDVGLLHQMKALVLLRDVERLKSAVEEFLSQSVMPPDHAKSISSLFLYWITDILPGKHMKEAECAHPSVQS
uniref:Glutamate rich 1 n=1 Tax=Anolis carolinensis TaxID=28377 RepID=R4GD71_ANOCA|nr:PREDICTED: glutamate-rich protein 1 isoform X2 [Anolis carolinensis]|eukprot:XP_003215527.1 PREDICTED: glutamate-rich protein 1 isoform X2 [Anolis carolinensis]